MVGRRQGTRRPGTLSRSRTPAGAGTWPARQQDGILKRILATPLPVWTYFLGLLAHCVMPCIEDYGPDEIFTQADGTTVLNRAAPEESASRLDISAIHSSIRQRLARWARIRSGSEQAIVVPIEPGITE
jgi:hypothetical protein